MKNTFRLFFFLFFLLLPLTLKSDDNASSPQERSYTPPSQDPSPTSAPNFNSQQNDNTPKPVSLVNETSAPSAIVNGSVNVISGDFIASGTDCIVSGPDGYVLGHNYTSSLEAMEKKNLGYGWSLQHSDKLLVFQPQGINYTKNIPSLPNKELLPKTKPPITWENDYTRIYLSESHGGKALFKGDGWAKHFKPVIKKTGFTNTNGQTNLKNISVHLNSHKDEWIATLGDNTKRIYKRIRKQRTHLTQGKFNYHFRKYRIAEEIRPSGNKLKFKYDDNTGRLAKVETVNHTENNILSWVKFKYLEERSKHDNIDIQVETSDGDTFLYGRRAVRGLEEKEMKTVTKIQRPGIPLQHIYYTEPSKHHERRVSKICYSKGNSIENFYYHRQGPNIMRNHVHKRDDKKHLEFVGGKVRLQKAPLGPGGTSVPTHTYYYHNLKNRRYHTTVTDPYNTKTRYYHGLNKRLLFIEKIVDEQIVSREHFIWGKRGTSQEGNLLCCKLYDGIKAIYARSYEYDSSGNVHKETHFGDFTGKTEGNIRFDGNTGMPKKESPCDVIEKITNYSNDAFNLKVSEKDFDGNHTYYHYKPNTNLLIAKLICEGTKIRRREFFTYDQNAILIKEIIDDGSSEDKYDFTDVTERKIKVITPRYAHPNFGAPDSIEEFYQHPKTKDRCLLTLTHNTFDERGLVVKKILYDSKMNKVAENFYTYDNNKRVISTIDAAGRVEKFEYDNFGRVIKKKGPRNDIFIHYTYDMAGRLVKEEEQHLSGLRRATSYEYDLLNRKIATIDPQGNETKITYDQQNRIVAVTSPKFDDGSGKLIQPKRLFSYEKYGRIVEETDERGYITKRRYNTEGKPLEEVHPDGRKISYYYDLRGNLEKLVHPTGLTTTYEYDFFGNRISELSYFNGKLLSSRKYEYNAFHLLSETSPTGEVITYKYDYAGRKVSTELTSSKGEKGKKIHHLYDDLYRLIEEREGNVTKKIQYDALSRIVSEVKEDESGKILDWKSISYDLEGNPSKTYISIDGKKAETKVVYYPNGIPKKKIDAEGNVTTIEIDHFFRNKHNQLVVKRKTTNPNGVVLEEVFNTRGFISNSQAISPFGKILSKKKFIYDESGNITAIVDTVISKENEKDVKTKFSYGPGSQLLALYEAASTKDERKTYFEYNKIGQKNKVTHADGSILTFTYDAKGRLKHQNDLENTIDYSYSYDASDRLLCATNNKTKKLTKRSYDSFGNLYEEVLESGLAIGYGYNKEGLLKSLTLPDQSQIAYSYSSFQLKSVSRISSSGKKLYSHEIIERDQSSNIISQKLVSNCGELKSHYDILGRVTTRTHAHLTESIPKSGYDPVGNLLAITVLDPIGKKDHSFSYNHLSQLIKEDGVKSHEFSYDSLNNRLSQDAINYQVNDLNLVLKAADVDYIYDRTGRRVEKVEDLDKTSYSYDVFDRLTSLDRRSLHVEYDYDAFHRRISKSVYSRNGSTLTLQNKECYLYIQDDEIGIVNTKGEILQLRLLGEGLGAEIGAAIACEIYGELYIPLSDHRGNVAVMLSKDGAVAESYRYSAFGQEEIYDKDNELLEASEIRNPWRFSSKRVDEESGFVYYGRRYYDPELGKWLTKDPLGLKAGPNLYAFLLNNPLTSIDLYGLVEESTNSSSNTLVSCLKTVSDYTCSGLDNLLHHTSNQEHITQPICNMLRSVTGSAPREFDKFKFTHTIVNSDKEPLHRQHFFSVMGINTTYAEGYKMSLSVVEKLCVSSEHFYSHLPTHGLSADLHTVLGKKLLNSSQTAAELAKVMNEQFDIHKMNGMRYNPILYGHSGGGLECFLALQQCRADVRKATHVITVGSAKIISTDHGVASALNIIHRSDLVPRLSDPIGMLRTMINHPNELKFIGSYLGPPLASHSFENQEHEVEVIRSIKKLLNIN